MRGQDKSEARGAEGAVDDIGKPTVAVVTLVLATQGRELAPVKDVASLRSCLSTLGSDALDNDSLLAAEVPERNLSRSPPGRARTAVWGGVSAALVPQRVSCRSSDRE